MFISNKKKKSSHPVSRLAQHGYASFVITPSIFHYRRSSLSLATVIYIQSLSKKFQGNLSTKPSLETRTTQIPIRHIRQITDGYTLLCQIPSATYFRSFRVFRRIAEGPREKREIPEYRTRSVTEFATFDAPGSSIFFIFVASPITAGTADRQFSLFRVYSIAEKIRWREEYRTIDTAAREFLH